MKIDTQKTLSFLPNLVKDLLAKWVDIPLYSRIAKEDF